MTNPNSRTEIYAEVPETPLVNILLSDLWFSKKHEPSLKKFRRIYGAQDNKVFERKLTLVMDTYYEIRKVDKRGPKKSILTTMDRVFGNDRYEFLNSFFGAIINVIARFNKSWKEVPLLAPKQEIIEKTAKQLTINFPSNPPDYPVSGVYTEL